MHYESCLGCINSRLQLSHFILETASKSFRSPLDQQRFSQLREGLVEPKARVQTEHSDTGFQPLLAMLNSSFTKVLSKLLRLYEAKLTDKIYQIIVMLRQKWVRIDDIIAKALPLSQSLVDILLKLFEKMPFHSREYPNKHQSAHLSPTEGQAKLDPYTCLQLDQGYRASCYLTRFQQLKLKTSLRNLSIRGNIYGYFLKHRAKRTKVGRQPQNGKIKLMRLKKNEGKSQDNTKGMQKKSTQGPDSGLRTKEQEGDKRAARAYLKPVLLAPMELCKSLSRVRQNLLQMSWVSVPKMDLVQRQ